MEQPFRTDAADEPGAQWLSARWFLLMAVVSTSLLGACTSETDRPSVPRGTPTLTAQGQPNGEPRTVHLKSGRATVTYPVVALDPPTHTFSVRIVASGHPDLAIWFTTDYGARLRVASRTRRGSDCAQTSGEMHCVYFFAELEAQHAGDWVIHIRKRSTKAATVAATVLFEPSPA